LSDTNRQTEKFLDELAAQGFEIQARGKRYKLVAPDRSECRFISPCDPGTHADKNNRAWAARHNPARKNFHEN
jgi:hypothetical protein